MKVEKTTTIKFTKEDIEVIKKFQKIEDEMWDIMTEEYAEGHISAEYNRAEIIDDLYDFANQTYNTTEVCEIKAVVEEE